MRATQAQSLPLLLAACLFAAGGCTSTRIDHGAIAARSFNLVNTQGRPAPEYAESEKAVHSLIQGAIAKNLAARQIKQVAQGGDVTVAYLLVVGRRPAPQARKRRLNSVAALQDASAAVGSPGIFGRFGAATS